MSDDEDWFERALREDEDGDSADADVDSDGETTDDTDETAGTPSGPTVEGSAPDPDDGGSDADDWAAEWDDDTSVDPSFDSDGDSDGDRDAGADSDSGIGDTGDIGAGADGDSGDTDNIGAGDDIDTGDTDNIDTGDDGDDGGSPFDQDFASALENAPGPDFGSDQSQPDSQGGGDPFGGQEGGGGDDSPFGGGGGDPFGGQEGGGSPFGGGGDPFGGGGDEFGFGDFGDEEPESFDEEEFESNLERLDIGIDGLDQMILGGVPRRSLMVAIGSAGTGKTTFGLQFLNHGLKQGENAVYITLEESFERIVSTADEKGWGFREYVDDDRLAIVDIDPIEMANSLDSIQNDLPNLIEDFDADRLVLDSVSLLEMMYESAPRRRSQVFGFARALKNAGITTLLTSEADRNHAYASRFGIVEYLADAVFVLQYVRPNDFQETRLAIEIQKIRDANHSRETKPYDLTAEGIDVYRQANIF